MSSAIPCVRDLLAGGQLKSRPKIFPLALSISVCLGIAPVALVVACSGRVGPSLANGVHL